MGFKSGANAMHWRIVMTMTYGWDNMKSFFRILWVPVVLTFSFTGKELRNNQISSFNELLERLDIKVLVEYVRESTTHVVARKRNTSKGLQALINGKYIVDHSFVDVIVNVTTADPGTESALESDFDSNWPKELHHLPPKGPEQTERPNSSYLPDTLRLTIFEGYTFVFYEQSQFDNLIAPVTNGKGKALLHQVDPASTTAEEFVRYVKSVAGEKGAGEFEDGSTGAGVVVVRYQPLKGPTLPFYSNFGRQVSLQLDHRLIEQSEFLDAILNIDATLLRRPLEVEPSGIVPNPSTTEARPTAIVAQDTNWSTSTEKERRPSTETAEPQPRRTGRLRRTVTSRFTGFDDEFSDNDADKSNKIMASPSRSAPQSISAMDNRKPTNVIEDDQAIISDESHMGRKRPLPDVPESDNEDIMEQLAPAAAKLKRLRLARGEPTKRPAQSSGTVELKTPPENTKDVAKKARKPKTDTKFTYLQQGTESSLTNSGQNALEDTIEDVDAAEVRNLALIKEMAARRLDSTTRSRNDVGGDRWDEKWNGRMNFKKFRKKGDSKPLSIHKVIVPLEEAKKKDFGIGDSYWLESDKTSQLRKKGKSPKDSQNGSPIQSQLGTMRGDTEVSASTPQKRIGASNTGEPHSKLTSNLEQLRSLPTNSYTVQSANKRPSTEVLTNPSPVKKNKRDFRKDDSDDSDDGLGFRFRKRK